jgi:hypothetical protein
MTQNKINIEIGLVGKHAKSLLLEFDAGGVEYTMRRPEPGRVMASGEWIVVSGLLLHHAAKLLAAWLSHRTMRRLNVTLPDGRSVLAEAPSVDEVERLMREGRQLMAMDASKTPEQGPDS